MRRTFMQILYDTVLEHGLRFVLDYGLPVAGEIQEDGTILVNPVYGDRVLTVVHEILHVLHPCWDEDRIEEETVRRSMRLCTDDNMIITSWFDK